MSEAPSGPTSFPTLWDVSVVAKRSGKLIAEIMFSDRAAALAYCRKANRWWCASKAEVWIAPPGGRPLTLRQAIDALHTFG